MRFFIIRNIFKVTVISLLFSSCNNNSNIQQQQENEIQHQNTKNIIRTKANEPITRFLTIKCSGSDYVWSGMLKESESEHSIEIKKLTNSEPMIVNILEKTNKLLVDNEEFKIIRSNNDELFAFYLDDKNLITIVINYKYGTAVYNKTFTNKDIGKQNSMSFVGDCINN